MPARSAIMVSKEHVMKETTIVGEVTGSAT